jgi:hypothetical protein
MQHLNRRSASPDGGHDRGPVEPDGARLSGTDWKTCALVADEMRVGGDAKRSYTAQLRAGN